MSPAERQQQLIAKYRIIDDPQERLAAVAASGRKWPAPAPADCTEAHRVPGCVSQVWLVGALEDGCCRFRMAADSSLVQGLAALLCAIYDGASPAEIVATEPEVLEALGIARQLSPTRLNGLASMRRAIRDFAAAHTDA